MLERLPCQTRAKHRFPPTFLKKTFPTPSIRKRNYFFGCINISDANLSPIQKEGRQFFNSQGFSYLIKYLSYFSIFTKPNHDVNSSPSAWPLCVSYIRRKGKTLAWWQTAWCNSRKVMFTCFAPKSSQLSVQQEILAGVIFFRGAVCHQMKLPAPGLSYI